MEKESIAKNFLKNALILDDDVETDPLVDTSIIEERLSGSDFISLAKKAVEPPSGLWETAVAEYGLRRPGFFTRYFSNPDTWLFDK